MPSSIEIDSLLLELNCTEIVSLQGPVYMNYLKAVQVANDPALLAKMGREANHTLFEYLIVILARNPGISLLHVKDHGDSKKM